jgi:signal peptidase II
LDRWLGALVVGGGSGNLVDRVQIGAVVDFLDFHWRSIHWPAFNLADVFIVCGALTWCLVSFRAPPRQLIRKASEETRS